MLLETVHLCHVFSHNWVKGISLVVMILDMLFPKPRNCINMCFPDYFGCWITERFYLKKVFQEPQKKHLRRKLQFSITLTPLECVLRPMVGKQYYPFSAVPEPVFHTRDDSSGT